MGKLVSFLYKLARKSNDVETLASGDSKKIVRRGNTKRVVNIKFYFFVQLQGAQIEYP